MNRMSKKNVCRMRYTVFSAETCVQTIHTTTERIQTWHVTWRVTHEYADYVFMIGPFSFCYRHHRYWCRNKVPKTQQRNRKRFSIHDLVYRSWPCPVNERRRRRIRNVDTHFCLPRGGLCPPGLLCPLCYIIWPLSSLATLSPRARHGVEHDIFSWAVEFCYMPEVC